MNEEQDSHYDAATGDVASAWMLAIAAVLILVVCSVL